jgi:hypothetical protein
MGPVTLALVATLSMAVAPNAKLTACRLFAPTAACGSGAQLFRLPPDPKSPDAPQFVIVQIEPAPIDCKMVKPVNPDFRSNMPVAMPNPKLAFPMKVVPVPSCDPKRR